MIKPNKPYMLTVTMVILVTDERQRILHVVCYHVVCKTYQNLDTHVLQV